MSHKTFSKPIIVEALCEIHFQLPQKWDATFGSQFFKLLQPDFPNFEPVIEMPAIIESGPNGIRQYLPTNRLRYRHINQNLILQLSENIFTVNQLKDYPGWPALKQALIENWKKLVKVTQLNKITRIGLRYINKIPREQPNQLASVWLKENEYIATCVLNSINGFLSRVETKFAEGQKAIITLVPSDDGQIIFDIDCIYENQIQIDNIDDELEILHQRVWDVFSKSLTAKLENFMNGN